MQPNLSSLNSIEFAALARAIATTTRQLGLIAPGFRSPPRIVGVDRTVRRVAGDASNGSIAGVVAVNVRERPLAAVVADMIEGVIILNQLVAADASQIRGALWQSLEHATAAHVA